MRPSSSTSKRCFDSVLVLVDRQLKNGQITVDTACPENLAIEGFPAELRQVFTNLVVNAADAAAPGGRITIKAVRSISASLQAGVAISVSDTGPGIEAAALEHVFEPFFTTKGERGTGLGLWVSHGIIEKHGGTIEIQSETGPDDHGTCITVFLPTTGPAAITHLEVIRFILLYFQLAAMRVGFAIHTPQMRRNRMHFFL